MKNKKEEKFLLLKQQVKDNLDILKISVENCTNAGMEDAGSELYNQVVDLEDDLEAIELLEELELLSIRATTIEKQLDYWLSMQGMNTMGLSWPDFSTKL